MAQRNQLRQAVMKARRSLNREKLIPYLQRTLLFALLASTLIIIASRLFIFPYYIKIAFAVGILVGIVFLAIGWFKRVRLHEAMHMLDEYYPHNELVTVLAMEEQDHPLVQSLESKALKETEEALKAFQKRKKQLFLPRVLISIVLTSIVAVTLSVFPATTQLEAKVVEKEKETIAELKKEVAALEKKATSKDAKKELQELQKKLAEVKTAEEALREAVKKQKELKLQEQKLKNKQLVKQDSNNDASGLTEEQLQQLKELGEITASLAKQSAATQSALGKLGKPVSFDLQNAIASEVEAQNAQANGSSSSNTQNANGQSQGQPSGQNSNGSGQGNGTGSGNSQGQGQGSGQGKGTSGSGTGTGTGSGNGGAGMGAGDRNLSIPSRIGGQSETTVDGGKLGEGTAAGEQQGAVPVTKGTVRPYEEVIGQYQDSYLQSTERLQLPKDLQQVVQTYFSSIEE